MPRGRPTPGRRPIERVEAFEKQQGQQLLRGDEDRLLETTMNTAEDDVFVQIPWMFGWTDPGEQRLRSKKMEDLSEDSTPPKGDGG